MAGTAVASELKAENASGVHFSLATQADDGEIRRLLRENPMEGRVALAFEREPNYFHGETAEAAESRQTIIAREGERLVCVGSCSYRQRFINGEARRVGYLGGLRLDAKVAGRFDLLRRGYQYFRELQENAGADLYFTSIAADNERAIRFLERGLPGMPQYEYLTDFVTLLLCVPRPERCRGEAQGLDASRPPGGSAKAICACLNEHNRYYEFAPYWREEELLNLGPLGMSLDDFRVIRDCETIIACAALWDQRSFKQTVIRGYSGLLSRGRAWLNVVARWTGRPRLPAVGTTLAQAAVSHLAVDPKHPAVLVALIHSLFPLAQEKGIEFLSLGFAANDPRLEMIRRSFFCREYRTRLYNVHWCDSEFDIRARAAGSFGLSAPELALL